MRRSNIAIVQVARELFTLKTAQTLADLTGYSVRACEAWISPTKPVPVPPDALMLLLRSDFGREFLEAIMRGAAPAWWTSAKTYFGIVDAMRYQRRARNTLKAALDADDSLRAAIARSEAALSVQDEDFARAQFDGYRAAGGLLDRPVAAPGGRGRR